MEQQIDHWVAQIGHLLQTAELQRRTSAFRAATGWCPKVSPEVRVHKLYKWLRNGRGLLRIVAPRRGEIAEVVIP